MGECSVVTLVDLRYDRREHLSLHARKWRLAVHDGRVQTDAGVENGWIQALKAKDVEDSPGAVERGLVHFCQ